MLTFYYQHSNSFTDAIQEKLEDMVVAHKVARVNGNSPLPNSINKEELPMLSDGHNFLSSQEEIEQYLDELHHELKTGRGMQSDVCHLDPDNPEECL